MISKNYVVIFLSVFLLALPSVSALSCVGISQDQRWDLVDMTKDVPGYFSTRIYNSTAEAGECEDSDYVISLSLQSNELSLDQVFDYKFEPERMFIGNGGNTQVLLKLTPKVSSGQYTLIMTATRQNPGEGGTSIVSSSSARINTLVGNNPVTDFSEIPFWTVRKNCPGGFVVKEGEQCPRAVCMDGNLVYGKDLCLEDLFVCGNGLCEQYENWNNCLEDCNIPEGWEPPIAQGKENAGIGIEIIIAIIAVVIAGIALAFAFFYIRQVKKQLKERRFG